MAERPRSRSSEDDDSPRRSPGNPAPQTPRGPRLPPVPTSRSKPASSEADDPGLPIPERETSPPVAARKRPLPWPLLVGAGGIGLLLIVGVIWLTMSPGTPPTKKKSRGADSEPEIAIEDLKPISGPSDPVSPVKLRINTPEPGFAVLVDGNPVLNKAGELVLTPCEVSVQAGRHSILTAKKGWTDVPRIEDFGRDIEVDCEPMYEPFATLSSMWTAPYLTAKVGEPIVLPAWDFDGRVGDPYVSDNGCTLLAAAEGPEGTGVYISTRTTPYDEWETPTLLLLSRGSDLPGSPSMTEEGHLITYTIPEKSGRIWSLTRKTGEETYDDKQPLLHTTEKGDPAWPIAQISSDGLRMYLLSVREDRYTTFYATREQLDFDFQKEQKFKLAGGLQSLSQDELRHYRYDGQYLTRSERGTIYEDFGTPQIVSRLELPDYAESSDLRRVWVTPDEQWMYYAPKVEEASRLCVVRLSVGPQRGVRVIGRALKPTAPPAEMPSEEMPAETAATKTPKSVKPAESTTPPEDQGPADYLAFREKFGQLIAERQEPAARKLLNEQRQQPWGTAFREPLSWDRSDLDAIDELWKRVTTTAESLKPGDTVRIGSGNWELVSYQAGTLSAKLKDKTQDKKLRELTPAEVTAFLDSPETRTDETVQLQLGIFLHYAGPTLAASARSRLQRAKAGGDQFEERLLERRVKFIEYLLAEQKFPRALSEIAALVEAAPKSNSAVKAQQLQAEIYRFVKWEVRNEARWEQPEPGTYALSPQKSPGTLLVSPEEFGDFDFSCEWMTTAQAGQGGVYFHYPGSGKLLERAFKIQLANDAGIAPDKYSTGAVFNYFPPSANASKPAGQWNTLQIKVRGDTVIVTINDKKVLESIVSNEEIPTRGYVAIDGEFGGISYRKLLLVAGEESAR